MPEELYNSHDYCLLVDEYEALKLENEELIADKIHLINAAMDGGNTYHYAAHDIGYRDMERKVKALEADYDISNRELLVKQVEIDRLTAELARRDEKIEILEDALHKISNWCKAYPLEIADEPTEQEWKDAHVVMKEHGFNLSKFAVSAMRRVTTGVAKIADLEEDE